MSKKDFEAVAKVLRTAKLGLEADDLQAERTRAGVAKGLADHFASRNPRFDRDRFLAACEVES